MDRSGIIRRAPERAQSRRYDLIVIGGGIYGAMLALESARRGLKPLLLERADFGGETSFNSLRIVHGGLRYLQKLDLHRFKESVAERKWFLQTFPHIVKPLPCLMPLYGKGMHRPSILRLALKLNDRLSAGRNHDIPAANHLHDGSVIGDAETRRLFPDVSAVGLKGAAKWHDAVMLNSQRILIEVLRWACRLGADVLNYTEANDLVMAGSVVGGVNAVDCISGQTGRYRAPVVINAAGPWSRKMAGAFHKDIPTLFRPSLAWNLLIDRPALSDHALAVSPRQNKGHTYFLVPWQGKLFAGTGHVPIEWKPGMPVHPTDEQIVGFLADLNNAVPNLSLEPSDIIHVHAGLLPARRRGGAELTVREVIVDHGKQGGPRGLYSVSGVKFTTARLVAEKTVRTFAPQRASYTPEGLALPELTRYEHRFKPILLSNGACGEREHLLDALRSIVQDESVCRLEDVIFRRTALYENAEKAMDLAPDILRTMRPDEDASEKDLTRLATLLTRPIKTP